MKEVEMSDVEKTACKELKDILNSGEQSDEYIIKAILTASNIFYEEEQKRHITEAVQKTIVLKIEDNEKLIEISTHKDRLEKMAKNLPTNPDKNLWLNRTNGILTVEKLRHRYAKEEILDNLKSLVSDNIRHQISVEAYKNKGKAAPEDEHVIYDVETSTIQTEELLNKELFTPIDECFKKMKAQIEMS
jgi:hypothetical protein